MMGPDLTGIDNLYRSLDFPTVSSLELSLIQGVKKDITWSGLSHEEKLRLREKELKYASLHFKESTPQIIFDYENALLELGLLIIDFLKKTDFFPLDEKQLLEMSPEELTLFRIRNMLYCELYSINKHQKLEFGGHVLFNEVVEPLFKALESSPLYEKFNLDSIATSYQKVMELYSKKPYQKNNVS